MRGYNIYYNNMRINNHPLNTDELKKVFENDYIYKMNPITNTNDKIKTNQIITRQCIIV